MAYNYGQGTKTDLLEERNIKIEREMAQKSEKQVCEESGGFWDEKTQSCVRVQKEQEAREPLPTADLETGKITQPEEAPEIKKLTPEEKADAEAKGYNIITDAEGNERIQTPQDVEAAEAGINPETGYFYGGAREAIAQQEAQQKALLEGRVLAEQAGQVNYQQLQQQAEQADVSFVDAFFKAVPDMIPDLMTMAGGAVVGITTGWTGLGAVGGAGAIVAGVTGAYNEIMSEMEAQKGQFSGTQEMNLEEGKQVLNDIISARNAGATTRTTASTAWNNQLTRLYQSYYNLQKQHIDNKFYGDDLTKEIAEFETYFSGEFVQQEEEFGLSLSLPNPERIIITQGMRERILNNMKNTK